VPGDVSARTRTGAKALACGLALFATAFAAGVAVRRGGENDPHVASPVAATRPAAVAGLAPATALPVLHAVTPRATPAARRRPPRAAAESGSRATGTLVAAHPAIAPRRSVARPVTAPRPVVVAARPAPQVPFTPVRHTVPAVRPAPAAPAPAATASRPSASGGGSVTFFSDGG
jgi:hypothetical protein